MYADAAGVSFGDRWSARMPASDLAIDLTAGAAQLAACVTCDETTYPATLIPEYGQACEEIRRCACIAMDHDVLASEYGATSAQVKACRQMYAAASLDAAIAGCRAPPIDLAPGFHASRHGQR